MVNYINDHYDFLGFKSNINVMQLIYKIQYIPIIDKYIFFIICKMYLIFISYT